MANGALLGRAGPDSGLWAGGTRWGEARGPLEPRSFVAGRREVAGKVSRVDARLGRGCRRVCDSWARGGALSLRSLFSGRLSALLVEDGAFVPAGVEVFGCWGSRSK